VLFPAEVLPIVSVIANLAHFGFGLVILVIFLVAYGQPVDPAGLPWFPVVVLVQLVFTLALALPLSAIAVHFRDLRDLLSNLLTFWFFATPIIYSYLMPDVERLYWLFRLNPFYHLVVSYQEILFFPGPFGHVWWLLVLGVLSVGAFLAGYFVFDRLRDSLAEAV
jgi:ABC-type polysaccharide/polyol phosphate export permease